jgi:hypothetical protein
MKKNIFRLTTKLAAVTHKPSKDLSDIFVPGTHQLMPEVRAKIKKGISKISSYLKENHPGVEIKHYELIGAAVTHQYGPTSDIDTTVFINLSDKGKTADQFRKINTWIGQNVDVDKFGDRPLQFKIMPDSSIGKNDNADAVYDFGNAKFTKRQNYEEATEAYRNYIQSGGSQERIQYKRMEEELRAMTRSWAKVGREALASGNIQLYVNRWLLPQRKEIVSTFNRLKAARRKAYGTEQRSTSVGGKSKNWHPDNILFKMFSNEKYITVFELVEKALDDSGKIDLEVFKESVELADRIKDQTIGYDTDIPPEPKGQGEMDAYWESFFGWRGRRKPLPTPTTKVSHTSH